MRIFALLFLVLLLGADFAHAGQYVSAEIGPYFPSENELDNDFNIEVAYGRDLTDILPGLEGNPFFKDVTAEVGIGYYEAEFSVSENIPLLLQPIKISGEVDVIPVTLTGIYTLPLSASPVSLYGGAGLGLYFAEWGGDYETEFGINFVAGGKFPLNNVMALTTELEIDVVSDDVGGVFLNFGAQYRF